jgi:uncharacterized glyoxalase superfamily protein PhnB
MAAKKKKAARKAVRKPVQRAVRKTAKATASKRIKPRRQPETLRLRSIQPGFTVNDIEKSVKWYTDVLGFVMKEPWMNEGRMMGAQIRAGASSLYLGQDDFKKGRDRIKGVGVRLYCDTAQDLDKLAAGIKQRGGTLDHEPVTQSWGTRDFGITDPDGYRITISSI